jgi:hypothetical protein
MSDSTVDKVIEEFSHLQPEDKEYVAEIIRKQLIEMKRENLVTRVQEAKANLEKGRVKTGTIRDLMEDLDRD